jgi:hypothetical protein
MGGHGYNGSTRYAAAGIPQTELIDGIANYAPLSVQNGGELVKLSNSAWYVLALLLLNGRSTVKINVEYSCLKK